MGLSCGEVGKVRLGRVDESIAVHLSKPCCAAQHIHTHTHTPDGEL